MVDGAQQTSVSFASSAHRCRSLRDLGHIARRWGYGYAVSSVGDSETPNNDDPLIAEGVLSAVELPCGVKLCANDLVASCDNRRTAIVPRSAAVTGADEIWVIERGRIVQRGRHDRLLAEEGGLYRRLWDAQSRSRSWRIAGMAVSSVATDT